MRLMPRILSQLSAAKYAPIPHPEVSSRIFSSLFMRKGGYDGAKDQTL